MHPCAVTGIFVLASEVMVVILKKVKIVARNQSSAVIYMCDIYDSHEKRRGFNCTVPASILVLHPSIIASGSEI